MIFFILIIILAFLGFITFKYYKSLTDDILQMLVVFDKIFADRYSDLSQLICQFQNYMPEHNSLVFDIQAAKAEVAKFAKPKTSGELAQKIVYENAVTLNLNTLLDKCDFKTINPQLKECVEKQAQYINTIREHAAEYNNLIKTYNSIKTIFPFNLYSKLLGIDLNLSTIES